MRGVWGERLQLSIFGESHGPGVGIVMSGLPAGLPIDEGAIAGDMARRAPGRSALATARRETDAVRLLSGVYGGHTNGAPLCGVIENHNTRSGDYEAMKRLPRPGHADYPAWVKHRGFADPRGGGHFSARLTAPLVLAGAVARQALAPLGIRVGGHIAAIAEYLDDRFDPVGLSPEALADLRESDFPLLRPELRPMMEQAILDAKADGDSVGGAVECAALGLPVGLGEPFFGSVESVIASLLFSIPAVKAVSFGDGEGFAALRGSGANDAYYADEGGVRTHTNHNGGLLGGLTNGMPLIVRVTLKPTPSIAQTQRTVDLATGEDALLCVTGRHDPCVAPRALPVVEAAVLLGLLELALQEEML